MKQTSKAHFAEKIIGYSLKKIMEKANTTNFKNKVLEEIETDLER